MIIWESTRPKNQFDRQGDQKRLTTFAATVEAAGKLSVLRGPIMGASVARNRWIAYELGEIDGELTTLLFFCATTQAVLETEN